MSIFNPQSQGVLGKASKWMTPERAIAMQGIGMGFSQMSMGQPVNMSPAHKALAARQQRQQQEQALKDSGLMDKFSPDERAILAQMEPGAAQKIIASKIFAAPAAPQVINGQLVAADGSVIGDYRTPEAAPKRTIVKGADGFNYYEDTGDRVLPGVEAAPKPTTGQNDYGFYVEQTLSAGGEPMSFEDWTIRKAKAGANSVTVNGEQSDKFREVTDTATAKTTQAIVEAGSTAQRGLIQIDRLETALANAPQGIKGSLANMAGSLGIKTEGSSELEVADAIISSLVPQQRPPGSGPMSDADLELFKRSLPRIINTPEGNRQIIGTIRRIAEYDVQRGNIAAALQYGDITLKEARDQYSKLSNPLDGFEAPPEDAVAPVAGIDPTTPAEIEAMTDEEFADYLKRVEGK